jgi:hypothetical protein
MAKEEENFVSEKSRRHFVIFLGGRALSTVSAYTSGQEETLARFNEWWQVTRTALPLYRSAVLTARFGLI